MLKIFIGQTDASPLSSLIDGLESHRDISVTGTSTLGRDVLDAVRSNTADIIIFPNDMCELAHAVKRSLEELEVAPPLFVVASNRPSKAMVVKSVLYGFHGVLTVTADAAECAQYLVALRNGSTTLLEHPLLAELDLTPGVLTRQIRVSSHEETEVVDLVGLGLSDSEISSTLGVNVQLVRNHIERVMHNHQLTHRTQLAVLRALDWKVPDFA